MTQLVVREGLSEEVVLDLKPKEIFEVRIKKWSSLTGSPRTWSLHTNIPHKRESNKNLQKLPK